MPAPAQPPVSAGLTSDIAAVIKKPVMEHQAPAKVVPPELKRMVDQESAAQSAMGLPVRSVPVVHAAPAKKSWWSRLFSRKSQAAALSPVQNNPFNQPLPPVNQPSKRPSIDDVKFAPKLFGPNEELSSLTVADFRRLARDPQGAAKKIMEKLDLLGEESLEKKAVGIDSLKKSELYRQYSDIMSKSIASGRPFAEIVAEQKTMKLDEFNVIMALNRQLKY